MGHWPTGGAFAHSSIVLVFSQVTPRVSSQRDRSVLIGRPRPSRPARRPADLKRHGVNTWALSAFGKIQAFGRYSSSYPCTSLPSYGCSCRVGRMVALSLVGSWLFCSSPGLGLLYFSLLRRPRGIGRILTCDSFVRFQKTTLKPRAAYGVEGTVLFWPIAELSCRPFQSHSE